LEQNIYSYGNFQSKIQKYDTFKNYKLDEINLPNNKNFVEWKIDSINQNKNHQMFNYYFSCPVSMFLEKKSISYTNQYLSNDNINDMSYNNIKT